jgi:hypothetical protein
MVTPASPCPEVVVTRPEAKVLLPPTDTVCVRVLIVMTPVRIGRELLGSTVYVTLFELFGRFVTTIFLIQGTST